MATVHSSIDKFGIHTSVNTLCILTFTFLIPGVAIIIGVIICDADACDRCSSPSSSEGKRGELCCKFVELPSILSAVKFLHNFSTSCSRFSCFSVYLSNSTKCFQNLKRHILVDVPKMISEPKIQECR